MLLRLEKTPSKRVSKLVLCQFECAISGSAFSRKNAPETGAFFILVLGVPYVLLFIFFNIQESCLLGNVNYLEITSKTRFHKLPAASG